MRKFKFSLSRETLAWCLYDWANSAFALTVMAAFFPIFFKNYWCSGADASISTARLGIGSTISGLLIAVLSLFLGAARAYHIGDKHCQSV